MYMILTDAPLLTLSASHSVPSLVHSSVILRDCILYMLGVSKKCREGGWLVCVPNSKVFVSAMLLLSRLTLAPTISKYRTV